MRKELDMNALPCSLHSVRVTVLPGFRVPLFTPGLSGVEEMITPVHGTLSCTITEDGWMLVPYPDKALLGLPLNGEKLSWEDAWEYSRISLEICTPEGWKPVEDWKDITSIVTRA